MKTFFQGNKPALFTYFFFDISLTMVGTSHIDSVSDYGSDIFAEIHIKGMDTHRRLHTGVTSRR